MAGKSKIEWTDATWNPVSGCTKVSAGCKHCYAERLWPRLAAPGQPYEGRAFTDVQCHPERLEQPLRWKKPRRVFVNSMSDLFHEDIPDDFIDHVFAVMSLSPQHTFQILTKRPERMLDYFIKDDFGRNGFIEGRAKRIYREHTGKLFPTGNMLLLPLPNVWLGVSVEDQITADDRIRVLQNVPAAIRWISMEPMIGPVECTFLGDPAFWKGIHWVVVGGESGHKARPMNLNWVRAIRHDCQTHNIPFFMKQFSQYNYNKNFKNFAAFPKDLRIREYPVSE